MSSLAIAGMVFGCILGCAFLAMLAARALPGSHLSAESKDTIKTGLGVIATLAALVLGLLVASTKGNYDSQGAAVKQLASNVRLLDRFLRRYGPEAKDARVRLHRVISIVLGSLWPEDAKRAAMLEPGASQAEGDAFYDALSELSPKTDSQRFIKGRALEIATELARIRLQLAANEDSSIPLPFLAILVFWLSVLFAGYGLLAPRNPTVLVVLTVCALSFAAALFLVLELDRPFDGIVRVSSAPLREALSLVAD